jgi:hypothetical protein
LKALLEFFKKLSIIFLKNFFEKYQLSNYYFPSFIQNLCKLACKGVNHKGILFSKDCILKTKFERYFQTSFYKDLFPTSKDLFQTLSPYLHLCKQTSLHCS